MRRTGRERQGDAYITCDIDGMDVAPTLRTGTPEVGAWSIT
jgi:arginase family enzyme